VERYKEILKKRLDKNRYMHSLGVSETAKELAVRNNMNPTDAYLAGILHDYAKNLSGEELLKIAQENNLIIDEVELKTPQLLHGPVGAYLIKKELGITNQKILNAIRYHTTACPDMDILTKIIYIADLIEPNRDFPEVDYLRKVTYEDLNSGILQGLNNTLQYVLENNQLIHGLSVQARNWLIINGW